MKYLFSILLFFSLLFNVSQAERCIDENDICKIGIFPHAGAKQIRHTYGTIAEDISFTLDLPTQLLTSSTLQKFTNNLNKGLYDIALAGPAMYARLNKDNPYITIARPEKNIQFHIISLAKLNINSVKDLSGKRVGQLTKQSGTWLSTKFMLNKAKIFNGVASFKAFNTDRDCAYGLISNLVDACGIGSPVFNIIKEQLPGDFVIIDSMPSLPSSIYLAHKDISLAKVNLLKEYLLSRGGLIEAKSSDYDIIRTIMHNTQ